MLGNRKETPKNPPLFSAESSAVTPPSDASAADAGDAFRPNTNYFGGQAKVVEASIGKKTAELPCAVIGAKIIFKGEIIGEEDLLIQGQVEGTINLKDHNLIVGSQGQIKANVVAKTITIEGKVEGDLFGQERIVIKQTSNVSGNLVSERVALEDGAKFRGSIDMDVESHRENFNTLKIPSRTTNTPSGQ